MRKVTIKTILFVIPILSIFYLLACSDENNISDPTHEFIYMDYYAVWSGVHNLIAYVHYQQPDSDDLDSSGIYVIKPDGTEKRLLLRTESTFGLDWSFDGTKLVTNIAHMLITISYPEGIVDTITQPGQYFDPSWSPDGSIIAIGDYSGSDMGIYFISDFGDNYRKKIHAGVRPVWVTNDSLIFLNGDTSFTPHAITIADTSGQNRREIYTVFSLLDTSQPKFNALKRRIVFHTLVKNEYHHSVYKLAIDSTNAELLQNEAYFPCLSPDGEKVVFTKVEGSEGRLWIINWDGTGLGQLTY